MLSSPHYTTHQTPQQVRGLAIYIHWPFCKSKCPYCDFNSHVRERVDHGRWQQALLAELEHMAVQVRGRTVTSIFFGGGTPSLMPAGIAAALIDKVHALFAVAPDVEITLEANPTSVEADTFPEFKKAGVNRVSLGVQSFDDAELKFLGRGHSAHEAMRAIKLAREHFARYSFDLIYARPNQTLASWEQELSQALSLAGGHLSLYQLTIEENTAFHHAYAKGAFALPGEEESAALYELTEKMTAQAGLRAYEISNYARAGEESRHNLSYWKGDEYIGVGPGAHGRINMEMKKWRNEELKKSKIACNSSIPQFFNSPIPSLRIATQTLKSPERWLDNVEKNGHALDIWQEVDAQAEIEERLMMGLRLSEGISYARFFEQTGVDLKKSIPAQKRTLLIEEGLLENDERVLKPTLKGRLVLNALTAELLP